MPPTLQVTSDAHNGIRSDGHDRRAAHRGAAPNRMAGAQRPGGAEGQHSRLREPGEAVGHRNEGDRRGQDRPDRGAVQRCRAPVRHRPAQRLHDQRRGPGRRRRLRQGRRQGAAGGRRRRHAAALRGARPGRWQDRPARRPADRRHRQADGRRLLRPVRRASLTAGAGVGPTRRIGTRTAARRRNALRRSASSR